MAATIKSITPVDIHHAGGTNGYLIADAIRFYQDQYPCANGYMTQT